MKILLLSVLFTTIHSFCIYSQNIDESHNKILFPTIDFLKNYGVISSQFDTIHITAYDSLNDLTGEYYKLFRYYYTDNNLLQAGNSNACDNKYRKIGCLKIFLNHLTNSKIVFHFYSHSLYRGSFFLKLEDNNYILYDLRYVTQSF